MNEIPITTDEYFALSRQLEKHHSLFSMMWELGVPCFNRSISTAAIQYNEQGEQIQFLFNPKFWRELDEYNRLFIMCHEFLHVIFNHGVRALSGLKSDNRDCTNACLDIVVNETLVSSFGFDRSRIQNGDKYCWVDTVFPKKQLPTNECFEFYYNKLPKRRVTKVLVDDHSNWQNNWDDVIDKLNDSMHPDEKSGLQEVIEKHFSKQAGTEAGGEWTFANPGEVKTKRKWETVIQNWAKRFVGHKDFEQWARLNRRFVFMDSELMLPTEMEVEADEEGRICVWFFQDTSGSCEHFKDRFFRAALSLPKDRFDVKLYCFDTKVYETSLETKKLFGFGGTHFGILENHIQQNCDGKYPRAVFVVTDGYGTAFKPQHPEVWHWFLSEDYRYLIPSGSNVYLLSDFE